MNIRLSKPPYQKEWVPRTPKQILEYIHKNVIFASTNNELLEIVIESLERLNERLHGTTPMVPFLWNFRDEPNKTNVATSKKPKKPKKTTHWEHKSENSISDFIKDHLRIDLKDKIFANREVEVSNFTGKGTGERVDILVEAMTRNKNSQDTLSVVIEAKGCWNRELESAMGKQLVDQYLIDSQHTHSIYLVYWTGDQDCKFKSIEELKNFLEKQIKELSVDSKKIKSYVLDCSIPER